MEILMNQTEEYRLSFPCVALFNDNNSAEQNSERTRVQRNRR
jgi:hypothetical protein